ncbi:hypothetical protein K7X08_026951 [Anisodus acutangulus]|uniref:Uncharacterized protein n=1 Tax=Anisodus acutangulus TaxID=402998 RepID=A0A9Q1LBH5_9SOLA|nr:hypothetical protein K7X08_026951 [Anisodus acutangulus]
MTGEEDLRRDDNKETDGGEVSYPASQDHQLEISHSGSFFDENKSSAVKNGSKEANIVAIEGRGTVQVERELKLEGESSSHNINIEHVGPARFPHEGGLRRRSSSSSSKPAMSEDIVQVATSAPDFVDTRLEKRDNEAVETSGAKPSVAQNDDGKLECSYDEPAVDACVHADDMNGSLHDHQLPVALVPRPVQTTSWKSCCGLFEVFAGSNK